MAVYGGYINTHCFNGGWNPRVDVSFSKVRGLRPSFKDMHSLKLALAPENRDLEKVENHQFLRANRANC